MVVEARLDKGRGPVATVLVLEGTLNKGDILIAGQESGKVRAMYDDTGKAIKHAGPSMPVELLGLSGVPTAGDEVLVARDERMAREIAMYRKSKAKESKLARQQASKLENIFQNMEDSQTEKKTLNLLVKADVQGSVEALSQSLEKMSSDEVKVNVIHGMVGGISESDVNLALASEAIIIAFNVRADMAARKLIENEGVEVYYYKVIYDAVDQVKAAIEGMLSPEVKEEITGLAEVRDVFVVSKVGAIAGCMVLEGSIKRNNPVRVLRDNVVIFEGKLDSLRRFKDDANEVKAGLECGIGVKNYNDIKVGDQIEVFEVVETKRTLD
jgi:translation initiation factor IF-2